MIRYEWCVECMSPESPEDVANMLFARTRREAVRMGEVWKDEYPEQRLVLVRDRLDLGDLEYRQWAYADKAGLLPERFAQADGSPGAKVPPRMRHITRRERA